MKDKSFNIIQEIVNIEKIKKIKFLLKGINIDMEHLKINEKNTSWPIYSPIIGGGILKLGTSKIGLVNNNGFYYCDIIEWNDKEKFLFLSHYSASSLKKLINRENGIIIEPNSFHEYGLTPDFSKYYDIKYLKEKNKNIVEIIDKNLLIPKKNNRNLTKKLKNQE